MLLTIPRLCFLLQFYIIFSISQPAMVLHSVPPNLNLLTNNLTQNISINLLLSSLEGVIQYFTVPDSDLSLEYTLYRGSGQVFDSITLRDLLSEAQQAIATGIAQYGGNTEISRNNISPARGPHEFEVKVGNLVLRFWNNRRDWLRYKITWTNARDVVRALEIILIGRSQPYTIVFGIRRGTYLSRIGRGVVKYLT